MHRCAVSILAAAVLLAASVACLAADDSSNYDYLVTDGLVNGMGFIDKNQIVAGDTECYAYGCMDALFIINNDAMCKLYPHTTQKDILNAVKRYYNENPVARSTEPIVQVLLAGCKPTSAKVTLPPVAADPAKGVEPASATESKAEERAMDGTKPAPFQYDPYICRK